MEEPEFKGICIPCIVNCDACQGTMVLFEALKVCMPEKDCESMLGFTNEA